MRSREAELLYLYLGIDLILLNTALLFVGWIDLNISIRNYHQISTYLLHANLSWIITYFVFTKKNLFLRDSYLNRIYRITKRQLIFVGVGASIALLILPNAFMRVFFLEYSLLFYLLKVSAYWLLYRYLKFKRGNRINTIQTAIIGFNDSSRLIRRVIDGNPNLGYGFSGYISSKKIINPDVIGTTDKLEELIDKHGIQMIFYPISLLTGNKSEEKGEKILQLCNRKGVRFRLIPQNQRWFRGKGNMEALGHIVIINPQEIPLDNVNSRIKKRMFDIFFSLLVTLLLLSWLFPIMALLIKLDSKGPVFFRQARTGINNKTFDCLKFRSMKVNGDANKKQASADDDRITRFGHFIRKTNIDELPQFINVLAGNMSVVGPRPHMLKHTRDYSVLIDKYLIRHYVKPGITGWAQVKGYRGETRYLSAMEKRVSADMEYIENWNFFWDLKIIWLTVFGKEAFKNAG